MHIYLIITTFHIMYLGKRTRKIIFKLKNYTEELYRVVKKKTLLVPPHLMFYRKVCYRLTHGHTYILCTCYAQSFYWLPTSQKNLLKINYVIINNECFIFNAKPI
jgi:hypothetical protein